MKRILRNAGILTFLCLIAAGGARNAAAQTLTVDTVNAIRTIDTKAFGINVANWSDSTNYLSYLQELAPRSIRWGGGSTMDEYHWLANTDEAFPGSVLPTPIDTWLADFAAAGATDATMEVNYGSGTASEAASLVQHCVDMGYHFEYWEVGNECYGSWEYDTHALKQDPYTYAAQFQAYYNAMKAVDPNIKIGCPVLAVEDDGSVSPNGEFAINPTDTAQPPVHHTGWTPVLLDHLKALGVTPDFVVWHAYPYGPFIENDASLLSGVDSSGKTFAQNAASIRKMLNDYLGTNAPPIQIYNTEWSTVWSGPGKQSVSLVAGLYMAQAVGASIQTEIVGNNWWVFNNTNTTGSTGNNNNSSLYGWRTMLVNNVPTYFGDYALIQKDSFERYPTFYMAKLLGKWITGTDQVLPVTTTQPLLTPYAVKHADGSLGVIVINKSPNTGYNATINFSGYSATGTATLWSYGIANDTAAQTGTGNRDLSQTTQSVSGSSFSATYPAYSVTLVNFPSAAPAVPPVPSGLAANSGPSQIVLTWSATAGATSYSVKRSTVNGSGDAAVASPTSVMYTNTGLTNGVTYYYVVAAVNAVGSSANSTQVSATPHATIPAAPAGLMATRGNTLINLVWNASAGAATYNVKRSTVSGGGYATIASPTTTSYTNTGLTNGVAYYYVVSAVNAAGESPNSTETSATPVSSPLPLQINCAGPAVSPFIVDSYFSGGTTATSWTGAVDTSAVTSPAPQAVYQTERYGASTYTMTGLPASQSVNVRLHMCENYYTASAQRTFNVAINGTGVLSTFDIFSAAGAAHKAVIKEFPATTDASGQVVVAFTNILDNALINGIEVLSSAPVAPSAPTGLTANGGNAQVVLSWTGVSNATSYNVSRSTVSGSGYASVAPGIATTTYTNTGLTNGIPYYFVVSATNSAGTSPNSAQASATPAPPAPQAQIAPGTPVIDGNNSDAVWSTATSYPVNHVAGSVVSGADLSASWTGAWDSTNLYVLVDVTDDVKVNDSVNVYDDDSVEVYLDADHNGGTAYDANDRQILYGWGDAAAVEGGGRAITGVTFAKVDPTGTTYRVETAIPWAVEAFTPAANAVIGIDVHINDDDDGGIRDGKLMWNDTTDTAYGNPGVFGSGVLNAAVIAPAAPTGLTATPGNTQAILSWTASSGATSYNALRSTVSGSGYASVATGIATTTYTNTGLTNGTPYYFVVSATNAGGTSANSAQASATPIGSSGNTHTGTWAAKGVFTGTPSHAGIYNSTVPATANTNYVASIWLKGTGVVSLYIYQGGWGTQVATLFCTATSTWQQFTTPVFSTGANTTMTFNLQDDSTTAGTVYVDDCFLGVSGGSNVLPNPGFESGDVTWLHGTAWTIVQPGGVTPPSAPTGLTATPGNAQVALSWTASSGATSYNVLRSTVNGSGYASVVTGITPTTYTNTGLTNGTTYYFVVTATNAGGTSGNSSQASATPVAPPAAPTGLTATGGNTQVALSWTASANATSYNVLRSTVTGSGYAQAANVATTSYTNTGLTNGTTYFFVVNAANAGGTSANSAQASATPQILPPAAPTGLAASPGNTQVSLTWTATSGATSYSIFRGTAAGGESATAIATGIATTSYTNTGLTNGTTYYYKIKAVNAGGTSPYSNEASAMAQVLPPTNVAATAGNTQVSLTWTASTGATSYSVFRGTTAGGESATAIATGIATTAYTNTGLTNGTTYYYKVKAVNATSTSAYSNEASAAPISGNTHNGTWAGKGIFSGTPSHNALYQDTVAVPANTNYVASVWLKGTGVVSLYIYQGGWGTQVATLFCTATSTWQQFTTPVFSTGANTTMTFNLQDDSTTAGTVYVDDCFLGVSGGSNVLPNPGFESGNVNWGHGAAWSILQNP